MKAAVPTEGLMNHSEVTWLSYKKVPHRLLFSDEYCESVNTNSGLNFT